MSGTQEFTCRKCGEDFGVAGEDYDPRKDYSLCWRCDRAELESLKSGSGLDAASLVQIAYAMESLRVERDDLHRQLEALRDASAGSTAPVVRLLNERDELLRKVAERQAEIKRLKDIIKAQSVAAEQKTIRIEVDTTAGCRLIVTDAIGDEEKLAHTIAEYLALLMTTAATLAAKEQ